tara:strand:+ start:1001 stop:2002 length:1002 start_codon:yes stop_codon:yes gene_type:complete
MKLLITGGSGYVGSRLTYFLLKKYEHIKIYNYDLSFFGDDHLPLNNKNYLYIKEDIRSLDKFNQTLKNNKIDVVLHLACLSNDPSFELNPKLSRAINYECFEDLVLSSKKNNVKKFIYASSSSVYGVSSNPRVDETHKLVPLTDYNKYKGLCEPILQNNIDDDFQGIIIRPATVCGYSEKMRFDLSVNILTNFAYNKNYINIFGGEQYRPNLHIDDMCDLYDHLIFNNTKKVNGEIFNAGSQNLKIKEIAEIVAKIVTQYTNKNVNLNYSKNDDNRSYRITSDKIYDVLNFNIKKNIEDAVHDLCKAFEKNLIKDSFNEQFVNIKTLQKLNLS